MHFHLPKPLHGWREFTGEVGIIVIGVLIALGAEQMVEGLHDRSAVRELRGALRGELADDRARWEDLRAADPCLLQRLDALDRWLVTAPSDATVSDAYQPIFWNMHSEAWDLAKASPVTERVPLEERLTFASLYSAIQVWGQSIADERENGNAITALFATADQPVNRAQIRAHIVTARLMLTRRKRNYSYVFTRFNQLGIASDRSKLTIAFDPRALCAPLHGSG